MGKEILTETGRLQDKLLPAVYFDSSVVIDYWMTEELVKIEATIVNARLKDNLVYQEEQYIKDLMKTDIRLNKVVEIRKKLNDGQAKATAVISPICLLELAEWYAEANFKQVASKAVGVMFIQKKGKKEIGDYLGKLVTSFFNNRELKTIDKIRAKKLGEGTLLLDTSLPLPFAGLHEMQGLVQTDIVNFNLSCDAALYPAPVNFYAYMQVGYTDIMHILFAQHLGCNYIASFDSDFKRVRELVNRATGMELLTTPEEILGIL